MAGIYIHIPFCKQACHYCNFHFSTSLGLKEALVQALKTELSMQKDYLGQAKIESIYFGGGTPSILSATEIDQLINQIHKFYTIDTQHELTLEANPDDLSKEKLSDLSAIGVNRLSIGIQSFYNEDLLWMNRSHDASQAFSSIKDAQDIGITDLSIDLIFGSHTTTMSMWEDNLLKTTQLDIPHISCYGLTVEEGTALSHHIASGKTLGLDNALGAEQFQLTSEVLGASNYEHYEISNYAKNGCYSKHNTNYWKQVPYLGIGPAAHSYNGTIRQWNIANNKKYIDAIAQNQVPSNTERLTTQDKFNEYIMTGLRTMWGCNLNLLTQLKTDWQELLNPELTKLVNDGHIIISDSTIILTSEGKLLADKVMSQLFITV